MTTPTASELALLRTQPQQTQLFLSIFDPQIVFQAQVNDASITKGERVITYNNVPFGNFLAISGGMTLYVGTTAGAKDKGSIYTYKRDATTITVGENSHINWADDDFLTIVNFHQIWPVYPRYTQQAEDITVFKFYDLAYNGQNEDLGENQVMGSNFAGFIDATTGTAQVYWDGSETENVYGTTGSTYSWSFEGGNPTGSTAITPGWITYDTPGHYRTLLTTTTPGGGTTFGIRHVSIYDRPGVGPNNPILQWGMNEFSGGRDEGGYTARLWVKQDVEQVVDGALVILFADDWYGDTQQSIGGNSAQRENIVFVGYIIDGSIEYDYKTSTVSFDVGSPTEIMKIGEAFSVSVEDSSNPTSDATTKGGDPWFYLDGLTVKRALWHYYAFHSSVASLMDLRYVGDDFDIQFFDADRTSLYDAGQTFLKSTVFGEMVCDRQGALYFEIGAEATNNAASSLNQSMFIDNHDWMGTPSIVEKYTDEVSYLEGGGVAYTNYKNGGDGSFSAMMGAAPGITPAYRGKNLKTSGLALTTQNQLNTMLGNVLESRNADFPEVNLDLVGNFRNLDIAPQEIVTLTVDESDTFRGISWEQKAFTPRTMSWDWQPKKGLFLPSVGLREVTQGNAGETIAIPVEPPSAGYEQPPIPLPPVVPPIPSLPPVSGFAGNYEFVPALDKDGNDYLNVYGASFPISADTQRGISWHISNPLYGGTSITIYPYVAVASSSDGNLIYIHRCQYSPVGDTGWTYSTTTLATAPYSTYAVSGSPGAFVLPGLALENSASGNWQLQFYFRRRADDASDTVDDTVWLIGFMVEYG
jgi:hypothetical protein